MGNESNMEKLERLSKLIRLQISQKLEDKIELMSLLESGGNFHSAALEATKLGYWDKATEYSLYGMARAYWEAQRYVEEIGKIKEKADVYDELQTILPQVQLQKDIQTIQEQLKFWQQAQCHELSESIKPFLVYLRRAARETYNADLELLSNSIKGEPLIALAAMFDPKFEPEKDETAKFGSGVRAELERSYLIDYLRKFNNGQEAPAQMLNLRAHRASAQSPYLSRDTFRRDLLNQLHLFGQLQ